MTTEELHSIVASRPTTEKLLLLALFALGSRSLSSLATWLGLPNSGSLRGAVARLIRDGLIVRDEDRRLSLAGRASAADSSVTAASSPPHTSSTASTPSSAPSPAAESSTPVVTSLTTPSVDWRPRSAIAVAKLLPTTEARDVWDGLGRRLGPDAWMTWANAALSQLSGQKGKTVLSPAGLAGCLDAFVGNNADLAYPLWKAYLKRAAERESAPELPLSPTTLSRISRTVIE